VGEWDSLVRGEMEGGLEGEEVLEPPPPPPPPCSASKLDGDGDPESERETEEVCVALEGVRRGDREGEALWDEEKVARYREGETEGVTETVPG